MSKVNREWARRQFDLAKTPEEVRTNVELLLNAWDKVNVSEDNADSVLDTFSEVAHGHALAPDEEPKVWRDAFRGMLVVGDTIRVKLDAFPGAAGELHNGREGVIVAIRNGDIIVRTTDSRPQLDGVRYPPDRLQVLVK